MRVPESRGVFPSLRFVIRDCLDIFAERRYAVSAKLRAQGVGMERKELHGIIRFFTRLGGSEISSGGWMFSPSHV
ncbi:MAG TPA: hypothetical protein VJL57_03800 [Candidatus Paceibacterota bacterium]